MKLYHFCAMRQGKEPGKLSYFDGTVITTADLRDQEQYQQLKAEIGASMDKGGSAGLILLSLTALDCKA